MFLEAVGHLAHLHEKTNLCEQLAKMVQPEKQSCSQKQVQNLAQ